MEVSNTRFGGRRLPAPGCLQDECVLRLSHAIPIVPLLRRWVVYTSAIPVSSRRSKKRNVFMNDSRMHVVKFVPLRMGANALDSLRLTGKVDLTRRVFATAKIATRQILLVRLHRA